MKKLFLIGLGLLFLSAYSVAIAAPVGNIATPAVMKSLMLTGNDDINLGIIAAGEVDLVLDRKIEGSEGEGDVTGEEVEIDWYGTKIGVSLFNKVLLYGLVGGVTAEQKGNVLGSDVTYKTETAPYWGIGASVIAYEQKIDGFGDGTLRIGGDLKYRSAEPDLDEVTIDGVVYNKSDWESLGLTNVGFEYGELQGALELSYQLGNFIPYTGVKFANLDGVAKATLSGTEYKLDFNEDSPVGMFLGADLVINDSFSINVEGRFIDEEAVNFGATIRF